MYSRHSPMYSIQTTMYIPKYIRYSLFVTESHKIFLTGKNAVEDLQSRWFRGNFARSEEPNLPTTLS